jgi:translocation and assembly module TamA
MSRNPRLTRSLMPFVPVLLAALTAGSASNAQEEPATAEDTALLTYETTITSDFDNDESRAAVAAASLLVSLKAEPLDSVGALFERARKDRERIRRALNALGYFGAQVTVTVEGKPAEDLEAQDAVSAEPQRRAITTEIRITRGPMFRLRNLELQGVPADITDGLSRKRLKLEEGAPARSAGIVAANAYIVEVLREKGYPLAAIAKRKASADHAGAALDIAIQVAPGPKATMGNVAISGTEKVHGDFIAGLAPFSPGDAFQNSLLKDFREEIERLNVFDAVTIDEAKELDAEGRMPLTVNVHERPRHLIGVAANWSTLDGAALATYWEHRNLYGEAERLRIDAAASRLLMNATDDYEYALGATLTLPAWPGPREDVTLKLGAVRERPDAYARDAIEFSAGWRHRFDKTMSVEAGVEFADATEEDAFGERDRTTVNLPLAFLYDTRNDPLEPVTGIRASTEVRPIMSLTGSSDISTRLVAQASAYASLDDEAQTVLAGRLALGVTLASDLADLPNDLRFYSGGGGSVRGYPYQHLSPRNSLGQIIGGESLLEGSVEVRHWIREDIGLAVFADAGGAFTSNVPDMGEAGVGLGAGIRYRTAVGPVRLDAAIPLDPRGTDSSFAVYVGLGQAF